MSMWQKETRKARRWQTGLPKYNIFFVNMINLFTFASELNNFSL